VCWITNLFKPTIEKASPKVRIAPDKVHINNGSLTVEYPDTCCIAAIAPTNSMDPVIDDGMFVVLDRGIPHTDLEVGDIIYYKSPDFEAIHRIYEVGEDADGWYCKCKGDNNSSADPKVVRKEHILGVWRATID